MSEYFDFRLMKYVDLIDFTSETKFIADVVAEALDAYGVDTSDFDLLALNTEFYSRYYERVFSSLTTSLISLSHAATISNLYTFCKKATVSNFFPWYKIYDILMQQTYNPLDNAYRTETTTIENEYGRILHHTDTGTITDSENIQYGKITATTANTTNTAQIYGYNSSSPSNADNGTSTGSQSENNSGTDTNTATKTLNTSNSDTNSGTDTTTTTFHTSGSIGVVLPQTMIDNEVRVRILNDFWNIAFADCANALFIKIY